RQPDPGMAGNQHRLLGSPRGVGQHITWVNLRCLQLFYCHVLVQAGGSQKARSKSEGRGRAKSLGEEPAPAPERRGGRRRFRSMLFYVIYEVRSRFHLGEAHITFEEVRFISVAFIFSKFAEKITFRQHVLDGLLMIDHPSVHNLAPDLSSLADSSPGPLVALFLIKLAEPVDGAMQQDAEIGAVHPELHAYIVVIALLKELGVQKMAVALGQHGQDFPNLLAVFLALNHVLQP